MESGYHSEWWFNLDVLFDDTARLQPFVDALAHQLQRHDVEVICGPMSGGAKLATLLGETMARPATFSERFESPDATGMFPVRYVIPPNQRAGLVGKRVAIVDDAVSAGSAVRGTYADLVKCGARPIVIGALFIFGQAGEQFAAENKMGVEAIARLPLEIWRPEECPHCRAGEPLEVVSAP